MTRSYLALVGSAALLWAAASQAAPSTDEKIDILSEEVERLKAEVARQKNGEKAESGGLTSVGGYGEMHYNNLDSKKEFDFHRFVLFFGHKFSDRIRFFSELELEHAWVKDTQSGTSSKGEVELEQAYIEFDLSQNHRAQGGLFLVPVGILNETHEPTTFYGVERNPVESNIIPSTWWEAGAGIKGELPGGLRYDLTATSGLKIATTGSSAYNIRSARQKDSNAPGDNLAYTGRLRWSAIPGVEIAASLYHQEDLTQSSLGIVPIGGTLGTAHAVVSRGPFSMKTLYARWHLTGGSDTVNPANGAVSGSDVQYGWYVEPAFKITKQWGVFARYSEWDNRAGNANASDTLKRQTDVGVNYWPHPQVVVKFDVQNQEGASNDDGFNLGIGYMF